MKNSVIKVLIADDQLFMRERVKQILADALDMEVGGEAEDSLHVLELIRMDHHWDVILLDIHMPGKGGIATLKELKSERPEIPVIVVSMYPKEQYAARTIKAGASCYLAKDNASEELIGAIRKAAQGDTRLN